MTGLLRALLARSPLSPRLIKFAMVGSSGVVVNNGVLFVLHGLMGLALPAASVMAIESAIVTNFLLNDRWTFAQAKPTLGRFLRFNLVSLGAMVVNLVVLTTLVDLAGLHYLVANLVGIGAAFSWNFLINVRWTWGSMLQTPGRAPGGYTYERGDTVSDDLVIIPTYNEAENIVPVVEQVLVEGEFDVLVVDDDSPDGTGEIADRLVDRHNGRVKVLHRAGKEGLGAAYRAAFVWALKRPYRRIYQMDADRSHDPGALPEMRAAIRGDADVVIGSRWVDGGGVGGWPLWRLAVSRFGSWFARTILRLRHRDLTGGFKGFRRPVLEAIRVDDVRSNGYAFQIEMTYRAELAGARVRECPILFVDRIRGKSKMGWSIILEAVRVVVGLGARPPVVDRLKQSVT